MIEGQRVRLRSAVEADIASLVAIRSTPEVRARWHGDDIEKDVKESIAEEDLHFLVIEEQARSIIGAIQWGAEDEPDYRHANMDIFLDPRVHRQGYGYESIMTLVTFLFDRESHHRITIDPAADNEIAIRCYEKIGFRKVGVMRQYERGPDGSWHDGVLMELLADDFHATKLREN
jgi:aminoglycoside 6'-N-acetyltransferase